MPAKSNDDEAQRKLAALHERLATEVAALRTGTDWQRWLDVAARFHAYSFGNTLLIHAQQPDATQAAGYQAWRSLGRQVTKGEKGIATLAPVVHRPRAEPEAASDAEQGQGAPNRRLSGFRVTYVWDIAQTTGTPLPESPTPALLHGEGPTGLWDALAAEVTRAGFDLRRAPCGQANGITNFATRMVQVRPDVDDAQATKTLAHELGHILLHEPVPGLPRVACRGVAEVEAESVAYLVAASHGLSTDGYTFPYVAAWADSTGRPVEDVVRATADRVLGATCTLLARTQPSALVAETTAPMPEQRRMLQHGPHSAVVQQPSRQAPARSELLDVHREALEFFTRNASSSWVPEYLAARSLESALSERWAPGYAPARWTALTNHLRGLGFQDDMLLASGLVTKARTGHLVDRFRDRLMLPTATTNTRSLPLLGAAASPTSRVRHLGTSTARRPSCTASGKFCSASTKAPCISREVPCLSSSRDPWTRSP